MIKYKLFIYIFVLSSSDINTYATRIINEGIVGGTAAHLNILKYQVAILGVKNYSTANILLGGGAIIASKFILTAAHCFINDSGQLLNLSFSVRLSTTNIRSVEGTQANIYRIYFADYDPQTAKNDIAVVELYDELDLTSSAVRKVKLPEPDELFQSIEARFSGYGYNRLERDHQSATGTKGSTDYRLRFTQVLILFDIVCKDLFQELILTDYQACGVTRSYIRSRAGVCLLDGGGPLIYQDKIVAILSRCNHYCLDSQAGAIYTKVPVYVNFIRSIINGNRSVSSMIHHNQMAYL